MHPHVDYLSTVSGERETTRVALLGATGSIGRQALDVIADDPTLEVCALASGSHELEFGPSNRYVAR